MSTSDSTGITRALVDIRRFYEAIDNLLREWERLVLRDSALQQPKDGGSIARTGPDSRPPPRLVGMLLTTESAVVSLTAVLPENGVPTACALKHPLGFSLRQSAWTKVFNAVVGAEFKPAQDAPFELLCIAELARITSLGDVESLLAEPVVKRFPKR